MLTDTRRFGLLVLIALLVALPDIGRANEDAEGWVCDGECETEGCPQGLIRVEGQTHWQYQAPATGHPSGWGCYLNTEGGYFYSHVNCTPVDTFTETIYSGHTYPSGACAHSGS